MFIVNHLTNANIFCDSITKYFVNFKYEKVEETHFLRKSFLDKVVFHEIKNVNSLRFLIIVNHFTTVVGNAANILFVGF